MIKVSVVVAIYGVELYLRQCLDSLLDQTYRNLEIILVDDGSPDNCPAICDEYAKYDTRIKVIHQKNQGSVLARQNGIRVATGEYISLIDGDDWLELNMYEKMLKLTNDSRADVVITGFIEDNDIDGTMKFFEHNLPSGEYFGDDLKIIHDKALSYGKFFNFGIYPTLWNKLFRRDLLLHIDIKRPDPIIKMGEDVAVSYPAIARANYIVIDNEQHLYHYRVVPFSMSRSFDDDYFIRLISLLKGLNDNFTGYEGFKKNLLYYTLYMTKRGIYSILSPKCNWSFRKKISSIKEFSKKIDFFNPSIDIKWDSFNTYDRIFLQLFFEGKFIRMTLVWLVRKMIVKLCSLGDCKIIKI